MLCVTSVIVCIYTLPLLPPSPLPPLPLSPPSLFLLSLPPSPPPSSPSLSSSSLFLRALQGNPLECGCDAVWLYNWLTRKRVVGPRCVQPQNLVGENLLSLQLMEFCGMYFTWLLPGACGTRLSPPFSLLFFLPPFSPSLLSLPPFSSLQHAL